MKRTFDILSFFAFPAAVLAAHVIASTILNLHIHYPNADIPFHFIGGFSIAYTATQILAYLEKAKMIARLNGVVFLVLIVSLTAAAAVFWEFAEFGADQLFHTNVQVSIANTMQDQFMGICGGVTWALIYAKKSFSVLAASQVGHR
jgi:hypothetical protein